MLKFGSLDPLILMTIEVRESSDKMEVQNRERGTFKMLSPMFSFKSSMQLYVIRYQVYY